MKTDGVTAICCRKFHFPLTTKQLKADYLLWKNRFPHNWQEIWMIHPMVIFLGKDKKGKLRYTCKNLQRETGVCMIYENRPSMCSGYPYQKKVCEYEECESKQCCYCRK